MKTPHDFTIRFSRKQLKMTDLQLSSVTFFLNLSPHFNFKGKLMFIYDECMIYICLLICIFKPIRNGYNCFIINYIYTFSIIFCGLHSKFLDITKMKKIIKKLFSRHTIILAHTFLDVTYKEYSLLEQLTFIQIFFFVFCLAIYNVPN